MTQLFTRKEAAQKLNMCWHTLSGVILRGEIDSTLIGKRIMFTEKHIENYIKKNETVNI